MAGAVPISMQSAAACKQKCSTAVAIHLFGMFCKVAECDPPVSVGIADGQVASGSVDSQIAAVLRERQQPSVTRDKLVTMVTICSNLLGGCCGIERAE